MSVTVSPIAQIFQPGTPQVRTFSDNFSRVGGASLFDRYIYSTVPGVGAALANLSYFGADNTGSTFNALHAGTGAVNGWIAMIYPKVMVNNSLVNSKNQFVQLTFNIFTNQTESGATFMSRWDYNLQNAYQMVFLNNGGVQLFRLIAWQGVTPRILHSSAPGFVLGDVVRAECAVTPGVNNVITLTKNGVNIVAPITDADPTRPVEGIVGLTVGPDFVAAAGVAQWDNFFCGAL
jgi:hypothetical protein